MNLATTPGELYSLPPHLPLLDAVALDWLQRSPDPLQRANGLILLPTRRAARTLADAFLRAANGAPLLLPRITALGALDETPLALAGALELPPAVEPAQRLAALARLILALHGEGGAPRTADRAWLLARELALLMDEAERAEIDLAERLPDAADPAYAAHWARTLQFLHIVTTAWPEHLAESGLMNPVARQVALLNAQAAAWETNPPDHPVLVAGTTAGIQAVARLLRVVVPAAAGAGVAAGCGYRLGRGELGRPGRIPSAIRPAPPAGGDRRDARRAAALVSAAGIAGAARAICHAQPRVASCEGP